jgi:hypothetical protein
MANAPPNVPHVSHSQYSDWLRCGKAYELKRVLGLAEAPAWWSIGGKGVHSATETYDLSLLERETPC